MKMNFRFLVSVLASLLAGGEANAGSGLASDALTPVARSEVVRALGTSMRERYVFPELGRKIATALANKLKRGRYDPMTSPEALQAALTTDLRTLGRDSHLRERFEPRFRPGPLPGATPPPEAVAEMRAAMAAASRRRSPICSAIYSPKAMSGISMTFTIGSTDRRDPIGRCRRWVSAIPSRSMS